MEKTTLRVFYLALYKFRLLGIGPIVRQVNKIGNYNIKKIAKKNFFATSVVGKMAPKRHDPGAKAPCATRSIIKK
jgi:hypothetical protein